MTEPSSNKQAAHSRFVSCHAKRSLSAAALSRFEATRAIVLRALDQEPADDLMVLDVGCGAATQCILWAQQGHAVSGLDVNSDLIRIGHQRAQAQGVNIDLRTGSATSLPFSDASFDVCLLPELLEHVEDWTACIEECVRVLRPEGLLFVSTTNALCPKQMEYNLPVYSWYPKSLKRIFEEKARTTRPELANFAEYPAVHWFTYNQLRDVLVEQGCTCRDRFDLIDRSKKGLLQRSVLSVIRSSEVVRWVAHVLTPYTLLVAKKEASP